VLARTVTSRSSLVVTLGAVLLVTVSLGPMAQELGTVSPFIWLFAAMVGGLQCLLIGRLAARLPGRAGGTATYVHSAVGQSAPILGAVSSWGYWFAWTPGIAVNLILAATYLRATLWHGLDTLEFALALGVLLYFLNSLGLRVSMRAAGIVAIAAIVPLAAIFTAGLLQPHLLRISHLRPVVVPRHPWSSAGTWLLISKWLFVAAWSAYGAEMASTVVAEMRDADRHAGRVMHIAGAIGLVAFGLIPFLMLALVGLQRLTAEPLVTFLPVAQAVYGHAGRTIVGIMLTAALVLGAQAFIVGSSRTIYQMTRDGYMPRQFASTNRHGAPVGSMAWDGAIIVALLLIFGTNVVNVVAAANVGYLIVFVLMPLAFFAVETRHAIGRRRLAVPAAALAIGLSAFNAVLLVVGGLQWGSSVMLTGIAVMVLIVPIAILRRVQDRRGGYTALPPFPAGVPHEPVDRVHPAVAPGS
jgi:amino acid transporter